MLNERRIRSAMAVARYGSLSKAASALYISVPSLSQQLDALESDLGFPLFERSRRGTVPTKAGAHFLAGAKLLLAKYEELSRESRTIYTGEGTTLRIGASNNNAPRCILQIFERFYADCREVALIPVSVPIGRAGLSEVRENRCDALYFADVPSVHEMGLRFTLCATDTAPWHVLMWSGCPLLSGDRVRPEDLSGYRVYCMDTERVIALQQALGPSTRIESFLASSELHIDYASVSALCQSGALVLMHPNGLRLLPNLPSLPLDFPISVRRGYVTRQEISPGLDLFLRTAVRVFAAEAAET